MVGRGCSLGGSWLSSPKARGIPGEELLNILSVLFCVCVSAAPDGPPMDVTLQPITSQSIQVTWKVGEAGMVWELFLTVGNWQILSQLVLTPSMSSVLQGSGRTAQEKGKAGGCASSSPYCSGLLSIMFYNKLIISSVVRGGPWGREDKYVKTEVLGCKVFEQRSIKLRIGFIFPKLPNEK